MSAFYGNLETDSTQRQTRRGHHWAHACARCWDGSVSVELRHGPDGPTLEIKCDRGSVDRPQRIIFAGPLADVLSAAGWAIIPALEPDATTSTDTDLDRP